MTMGPQRVRRERRIVPRFFSKYTHESNPLSAESACVACGPLWWPDGSNRAGGNGGMEMRVVLVVDLEWLLVIFGPPLCAILAAVAAAHRRHVFIALMLGMLPLLIPLFGWMEFCRSMVRCVEQ